MGSTKLKSYLLGGALVLSALIPAGVSASASLGDTGLLVKAQDKSANIEAISGQITSPSTVSPPVPETVLFSATCGGKKVDVTSSLIAVSNSNYAAYDKTPRDLDSLKPNASGVTVLIDYSAGRSSSLARPVSADKIPTRMDVVFKDTYDGKPIYMQMVCTGIKA